MSSASTKNGETIVSSVDTHNVVCSCMNWPWRNEGGINSKKPVPVLVAIEIDITIHNFKKMHRCCFVGSQWLLFNYGYNWNQSGLMGTCYDEH